MASAPRMASSTAAAAEKFALLRLCAGDRQVRRLYLAERAVVARARARAELEWQRQQRDDMCRQAPPGPRARPATEAQLAREARRKKDLELKHLADALRSATQS